MLPILSSRERPLMLAHDDRNVSFRPRNSESVTRSLPGTFYVGYRMEQQRPRSPRRAAPPRRRARSLVTDSARRPLGGENA